MTKKEFKEKLKSHAIGELLISPLMVDKLYDQGDVERLYTFDDDYEPELQSILRWAFEDELARQFEFCCGMGEIEVASLPQDEKSIVEHLVLNCYAKPYAGFILTNAYYSDDPNFGVKGDVLNKLSKAQYMGINNNTQNHIFLWAIPKETIISYYEKHFKEENKKRLKQVSSTAKKSPSKSSKVKG